MEQALEAGANGPRPITVETWANLIDFLHSSPTPVTTDVVEYVLDACALCSLPPSVPYAAALLLHRLRCVSLLKFWTGQQLFLVAVVVAVKFLCDDPHPPTNYWWCLGFLFEVEKLNCMEAEFCRSLDWRVAISGPELESFSAFCQWFMEQP